MLEIFKKVIEQLKSNKPVSIWDLNLNNEENNILRVTGWAQYKNFENLTQKECIKELEEIKMLLDNMQKTSPEFKEYLTAKKLLSPYFLTIMERFRSLFVRNKMDEFYGTLILGIKVFKRIAVVESGYK